MPWGRIGIIVDTGVITDIARMAKILTTAIRLNPKRISEEFLNLAVTVAVIINAVVIGYDDHFQSVTAGTCEECQHIRPSRNNLFDAHQILSWLVIDIYAHKGWQWNASIVVLAWKDTLPGDDEQVLFEFVTLFFCHRVPDSVNLIRNTIITRPDNVKNGFDITVLR